MIGEKKMASGNVKKFELKLGRAAIIVLVAGMTTFLCGSFLFGVHVGQDLDTHPEKISSIPGKMLALVWKPARVKAVKPSVSQSEVPAEDEKENIDLTFYNTLTDKKGTVAPAQTTEEKPPERSYAEITAISEAPPAQTGVAEKPKQSSSAVSDGKKQAVSSAKAAQTAPASASKAEYVVHVASLRDRNRALSVHKSVAALGYPSARVIRANVPGKGIWYRIMVPGFSSRQKAQAAADKISPKVRAKCIVRQAQTG